MTQRKVLASAVMLVAALGLAGCAKTSAPATNESHVRSARVAKKATSHKERQDESTSESKTSSSSSATSQTSSSQATQQSAANQTTATSQANSNSQATANSQSEQHVQLGLGDVAVWTENGVTHHVDSDGMDRQTTQGSSDVHYSDWSGQLPQGVQVQHN